jgi:Zn-dependent peptidase ImmA (M78 family)/DNA-binding XRE family transcriptional regulator
MTDSINPNMVILAREYRQFTQKELAHKLGVTPPIVSRIEAGLFQVSEEMLEKLSNELNFPTHFFYEQANIYPLGIHFYRKAKGVPQKILSAINAEINIDSIRIDKLLQAAKITRNNIPYIDLESNLDKYKSPSDIARAVRFSWNVPIGRIDNMVKILEDAGILIIFSKFNTRFFDAVSFTTRTGRYVIFVNSEMSADRIRFSLAHECGHIIMHRIPHDNIENEANEFAGEFLLPKKEIQSYLSDVSLSNLANLKRYWKVSMQAILMRAYQLDRITYNQYQYAWKRMSKSGYKLKEPIDVPSEEPTLLQELINIYMQEYSYTKSELKFLLHLDEEDYGKFNPSDISPLRVIQKVHEIKNANLGVK